MSAHLAPMRSDISEIHHDVKILLSANASRVGVARYRRALIAAQLSVAGVVAGCIGAVATLFLLHK